MRSIIKTDKSFNSSDKRISISPVLTYINNDIRKSNPLKLRIKSNNNVNAYLNESTIDYESDFEYY